MTFEVGDVCWVRCETRLLGFGIRECSIIAEGDPCKLADGLSDWLQMRWGKLYTVEIHGTPSHHESGYWIAPEFALSKNKPPGQTNSKSCGIPFKDMVDGLNEKVASQVHEPS